LPGFIVLIFANQGLAGKNVSNMTCFVSSGIKSFNQSINQSMCSSLDHHKHFFHTQKQLLLLCG